MEEAMYNNASHQARMFSPSLDMLMQEVMHMLRTIDCEHDIELDRVENSAVQDELKQYITEKLRIADRERRQPYVDLLDRIRMQHVVNPSRIEEIGGRLGLLRRRSVRVGSRSKTITRQNRQCRRRQAVH
jgi:hypothetical protein